MSTESAAAPEDGTRSRRDRRLGRDFIRLWLGQTVSLLGTQVSFLAIPLTAALTLKATPLQMGLLGASQWIPFLLVGLPAGAWIDRRRRRPIMIAADVGRAASLGLIPIAAALHLLSLQLLYICVFITGTLQVFFELSYQAYVPSLVGRDRLMRANSRIQASMSGAEVGGPGVAGALTQLLSAPIAVLVDALSYLVSAGSIAAISTREPAPARVALARNLRTSILDGLRIVVGDRVLRAMAAEAGLYNLFYTAMLTLFILFGTRQLGLSPGLLGAVLALGAVGSVVGAISVERNAVRWTIGRAMLRAYVVACLAPAIIPFAPGSAVVASGMLAAVFLLMGFAGAVAQVYVWSLRQSLVEAELLGRMNAAYRFIVSGTVPLGALLGGALGTAFGLRVGIGIAAFCLIASLIPILTSPIPGLRTLPASPMR